jgi:hypothetical protein
MQFSKSSSRVVDNLHPLSSFVNRAYRKNLAKIYYPLCFMFCQHTVDETANAKPRRQHMVKYQPMRHQ